MKSRIISALLILSISKFHSQKKNYIFTSDINHYWEAYDQIKKTDNTHKKYELINTLYIDKASYGLKAFMKKRNLNDSLFVENIEKLPRYWNSIRNSTLEIKSKQKQIEKYIKKFNKIYPELKPANIYFTIGGLASGGTTDSDMVLIGSEILVGNPNTDTSELSSDWLKNTFKHKKYIDVVYLTIHEYVHTNQKKGYVNLLGHSIKEGSCDFIAELVLGEPIKTFYIEYGKSNLSKVKEDFKAEMYSNRNDKWLYNGEKSANPDLGYFMGYEISKSYYQNHFDKKQAVKDIIELDFGNEKAIDEFVEKSKFFGNTINKDEIIKNYESNIPKVVKIEPFDNDSKNVDTATKQIKITFSKKMKDVSLNFSKNGKEHFPLQKKLGFENDKTTLILETVALKPNTTYDFYITNRNTESEDGYQFEAAEYKIEFTTL
ncbi:Ig-like domain-containing protein [Chryseobacterium luquanense]|uniref:Ig-like domain-containing protein n=1 Tax=Chryseobacterium luquanense TaxID=2983766 RepID=A0ABT3Y2Q3_9FLAO|nr:Ig-like domain-containing protein [Chryseobacterium luquanense]MCX8532384.1 Ig-like domain-containing protein [Chryseobacterium luquanense]